MGQVDVFDSIPVQGGECTATVAGQGDRQPRADTRESVIPSSIPPQPDFAISEAQQEITS